MSRRKKYIELVPQEILTYNIFSRLPIKSLGICKCVSKSWNSLISEPCFIKTHLTESSKNNDTTNIIFIATRANRGFLYAVYVENSSTFTFPFHYEFGPKLKFDCSNTWSQLWGSCDGLILAEDNRTWTSMCLINPTTLESKRLPSLPSGSRNTCMFGFGYDTSCDDYAVVAIAYRQDSLKKDACVYAYMLKTNHWNKVGLSPYDHKRNIPVAGIFVGGCLHWLAKNVDDSSWLISAFNVAKKKFSQLRVPKVESDGVFELGIVMGCLCMTNNINDIMTELWVMNEYGDVESWVKFTKTVSDGLIHILPEDTLVVLECGTFALLVINAKEGKFSICKRGFRSNTDCEIGMTYVNSLVSPNINKDENRKKNRGRRSKATIK